MDEATKARVFEPFFTTKQAGQGRIGIGHRLRHHQAERRRRQRVQRTRPLDLLQNLPSQGGGCAGPAPAPRGARDRGRDGDDSGRRGRGRRAPARGTSAPAGRVVVSAADGREALALLERHEGRMALMLTDVVMPGMNGRDLATRLRAISPHTRVLYTSGYTDDAILGNGMLDDGEQSLGKPYSAPDLTRKVRAVLDARDGRQGADAQPS